MQHALQLAARLRRAAREGKQTKDGRSFDAGVVDEALDVLLDNSVRLREPPSTGEEMEEPMEEPREDELPREEEPMEDQELPEEPMEPMGGPPGHRASAKMEEDMGLDDEDDEDDEDVDEELEAAYRAAYGVTYRGQGFADDGEEDDYEGGEGGDGYEEDQYQAEDFEDPREETNEEDMERASELMSLQ